MLQSACAGRPRCGSATCMHIVKTRPLATSRCEGCVELHDIGRFIAQLLTCSAAAASGEASASANMDLSAAMASSISGWGPLRLYCCSAHTRAAGAPCSTCSRSVQPQFTHSLRQQRQQTAMCWDQADSSSVRGVLPTLQRHPYGAKLGSRRTKAAGVPGQNLAAPQVSRRYEMQAGLAGYR